MDERVEVRHQKRSDEECKKMILEQRNRPLVDESLGWTIGKEQREQQSIHDNEEDERAHCWENKLLEIHRDPPELMRYLADASSCIMPNIFPSVSLQYTR